MEWIARLAVRRVVWIIAGLLVYAALNAAGVHASQGHRAEQGYVLAVHCGDGVADPSSDPCPTPTPTSTPTPTPTPAPTPSEDTRPVSLSAADRARLDGLQATSTDLLTLVGYAVGISSFFLAALTVTTGLRR